LLTFVANLIIGVFSISLSFWIVSTGVIGFGDSDKRADGVSLLSKSIQTGITLIFLSGTSLYVLGPNSVAFGVFLGSGWLIMNEIVDAILGEPVTVSLRQID
jgi:hypothetical protein